MECVSAWYGTADCFYHRSAAATFFQQSRGRSRYGQLPVFERAQVYAAIAEGYQTMSSWVLLQNSVTMVIASFKSLRENISLGECIYLTGMESSPVATPLPVT